ncbi:MULTISPECIES: hypothetical protein [Nocardia]|uniref:DUF4288 domain-containing protein n=1 Tax=Nocardia sputorum TaxID=2984338 RepID=A0ABN6U6T4_9NOCA|nr:hypothetical protein [Nocardia sputorum]BDT92283.1 hypothetical protein IFM12275_22590 [Nocardia sputorum]BDU00885.1 hypothetical protein IFM12276_39130 [Nocardia sputorum]
MARIWYSCAANYAIILDRDSATNPPSMHRSVFVFQAQDDPDDAIAKALEIARSREQDYMGGAPGDSARVVWRLESLETIDILGESIVDGREIYAEPIPVPDHVNWTVETRFTPDTTDIGTSGVQPLLAFRDQRSSGGHD